MSADNSKNVLVFNAGSASLKFQIIRSALDAVWGTKLLSGVIEPIGGDSKFSLLKDGKKINREEQPANDHGEAAANVLERIDAGLGAQRGISHTRGIQAVGHRVVHGADKYHHPVLIDHQVVQTIEELEELAPLHNRGALSVIRASRAALDRSIPQVAVFDTSFHRTMPDRARFYAIPWELTERHKIQRFGFHGISHHYLTLRYAEITQTPLDQTNIITLHLEGGSSATAVVGGRSVDTSMGFTPLEGLMMGTRSGDIDPALVSFIARKEHLEAEGVEELLNEKSGLLGVSGRSQDTRELVKHLSDPRTSLALDIFAYRVRKCIGAYLAAGNMSAIVFGGGIGENTPEVRRRILEGLDYLGLSLDNDRNFSTIDREGEITSHDSRPHALVIPTEEGLMIAREVLSALDA
jgi:acetate kinase